MAKYKLKHKEEAMQIYLEGNNWLSTPDNFSVGQGLVVTGTTSTDIVAVY